jgi:hypothetical protein
VSLLATMVRAGSLDSARMAVSAVYTLDDVTRFALKIADALVR